MTHAERAEQITKTIIERKVSEPELIRDIISGPLNDGLIQTKPHNHSTQARAILTESP